MMQSHNSLEVAEVHTRYKLIIAQIKAENEGLHKKYLDQIKEIQLSYQKEQMRVEEVYLNKIEYMKAQEKALIEEWTIKCQHKVEDKKAQMQSEIERLTVIINLYKEKLTRKENENRNIMVELRIAKEKIETIRKEFIDEIAFLKKELERRSREWDLKEKNYLAKIKSLEKQVAEYLLQIENLTI